TVSVMKTQCSHTLNRLQTDHQVFFFFSSRRRHTRSKRDWSSDVCSSDLNIVEEVRQSSEIPLVLMGYINPVMNYGISRFCQRARSEERRVGKECRCRWAR